VPRAVSVRTTINRIHELAFRNYDLSPAYLMSDASELERLANLIEKHYGAEHEYVSVCKLGIMPHYSSLPNGIRVSVEHAFRHKAISFVVCTSTLAQGVNIPIKYLLMTSFKVTNKSMQIRSFQNLMGRTARSGMYTEGSVLITDPTIYDNKDTYKHGGVYRWRDHVQMFDPSNSEPCKSSILMMVQNLSFGYDDRFSFSGTKIVNYLLEHYQEPDAFSVLQQRMIRQYQKRHRQLQVLISLLVYSRWKQLCELLRIIYAMSSQKIPKETKMTLREICASKHLLMHWPLILSERIFYQFGIRLQQRYQH
jgi:hypothetical protein